MSGTNLVAKRYAKALFEVAKEQEIIGVVEQELRSIVEIVGQNVDFTKLLQHPNVGTTAKIGMIKEVFGGRVSEAVFNTLQLLLENGRQSVLAELLDAYVSIANEALGQANAIVYSPFPLSEAEANKVSEKFNQLTGKKIRLEHVIDASLIGGFQVRIGDRLYDGSLSGKLARLEKAMKQTQAL